jgi:hypothetical protein
LNEGKIIRGLTIVDKPHSNCVSNEGKIIWELTKLLINHIQIVYRMKETTIWQLTIVDKPHSNCVSN